MNRIIKIILLDILKNKIVLAYTLILAALSWSSFALEDNSAKGLLTILNVILFTVPLVSILFATITCTTVRNLSNYYSANPSNAEKFGPVCS